MWNDLVTALDTWRNSVPWQFPVMGIIIILAVAALWAEQVVDTWRNKR